LVKRANKLINVQAKFSFFYNLYKNNERMFIEMGTRPCPPLNPVVPCDCSSTFTINQEVSLLFSTPQFEIETGNLSLNGSICPTCNNAGSNFTLVFVDSDPSDGDRSFTFIPLSIQPQECRPQLFFGDQFFVQRSFAVGLYIPANGNPIVATLELQLWDSTIPGQDDGYTFQIFDAITTLRIVETQLALQRTPENTIVVTDCP
jgi:hypothetical protein